MQITRFIKNNEKRVGLVTEKGIIDIKDSGCSLTINEILSDWKSARPKLEELTEKAESFLDPEELSWAAPTDPSKIVCIGLNYAEHIEEALEEAPKTPLVFSKMPESVNCHKGIVPVPERDELKLDFEAEMVIVIGKPALNVPEEEAAEHIFGYTCGNDVSDRAAQFVTNQMLIGKACPGFGPFGPYITTADDIDPLNLDIKCYVNGVKRQDSNTSKMIFKPAYLVSYISRYLQLNPGDVIFTGTPDGVIIGEPEDKRVWLKSGDEVRVEIEDIGCLEKLNTGY